MYTNKQIAISPTPPQPPTSLRKCRCHSTSITAVSTKMSLKFTLIFLASFACAAYSSSCVATLFANDPLRFSLSFRTGAYGVAIQNWQIVNFDSHIRVLGSGLIQVGVQGSETGALVLLLLQISRLDKPILIVNNHVFPFMVHSNKFSTLIGRIADVTTTVGTDNRVFVSIRAQDGILGYSESYEASTFTRFTNVSWQNTPSGYQVMPGHIYLAEVKSGSDWTLLVRMLVTTIGAGQVGIRWSVVRVRDSFPVFDFWLLWTCNRLFCFFVVLLLFFFFFVFFFFHFFRSF